MTIKTNLNKAIKLAAEMLKKMEDKEQKWLASDDKKLAQLTKLVGVLAKLMPMEEKGKKKKSISVKEDEMIIKSFLKRERK